MPPVTWIFQGSPDRFDIAGYLAAKLPRITWTVKRYADKMAVGDEVFLWRAAGTQRRKSDSGIIALAHIGAVAWEGPDHAEAHRFWCDRAEATRHETRVWLIVDRIAAAKEIVRRDWLVEDPICRELPVLKQPLGTNYAVPIEMTARLHALWNRTGQDWSRAESLAALRVYHRTYGGPLSKTDNSPVAVLALLLGRAIGGAYNKVLNFRALDPRDPRQGLDGVGAADRMVWAEFFDPAANMIRVDDLETEFHRLWPAATGTPESHHYAEEFQRLVRRNTARSLDELTAEYQNRPAKPRPSTTRVMTTVFDRDERVAAIARQRAGNNCEVPGCRYEPFVTASGEHYVEVHHIETLATGGADTPDNVACLCPAHHREVHYGRDAKQLRETLRQVRVGSASKP